MNGYNIKEKYLANLVKPCLNQTRTRDNLIEEHDSNDILIEDSIN
jgi:hypothetical protein